jgi:hypothetical protein
MIGIPINIDRGTSLCGLFILLAALPIVKKESNVNNKAGNEANIPNGNISFEPPCCAMSVKKLPDQPLIAPNVIPNMPTTINGKNLATLATTEIIFAALVEKALIPINSNIRAYATSTMIQVS